MSTAERIARIKMLAQEYFVLPDKALIEKYDERLRIFDIEESRHDKHPHKNIRVYMSRRSLKHFVEERKHDLLKRHSPEETIEVISFVLDSLKETVTNFDVYEFEPPKHFYTKDFSQLGRPAIRVLLNDADDGLEIRSMHLNKYRRSN